MVGWVALPVEPAQQVDELVVGAAVVPARLGDVGVEPGLGGRVAVLAGGVLPPAAVGPAAESPSSAPPPAPAAAVGSAPSPTAAVGRCRWSALVLLCCSWFDPQYAYCGLSPCHNKIFLA